MKLVAVGAPVESTPGACADLGPAGFNADPEVGITPYFARGSNGQPDYERGSVAIQTAEMGTLAFTARDLGVLNAAADGQIFSRGDFSAAHPDADNFCHVPALTPTRLVLAEIPAAPDDPATADVDESFPGQPAVDATLVWSNLRVYVTADTYGTQVDADLVDTRVTPAGDTCTFTYRALGLAPAVPCWAADPETGAPLTNPDGTYQLDPTACESEPDPSAGRFLGSGISPSARHVCDPVTAYCMIDGDTIPALR